MKRVLIVTYHFPPNAEVGGRRPLALANYLPEFGWEPTVLTVRNPDHVALDPRTLQEVRPGLRVVRTFSLELPRLARKLTGRPRGHASLSPSGVFKGSGPGLLGRINGFLYDWLYVPDKKIGWIPFGLNAALRLQSAVGFDVVLTTSPPHSTHLIGLAFSGFHPHVRWVADFRDLWTLNANLARLDLRARLAVEKELECRILRRATRVVTTSECSRDEEKTLIANSPEKIVAIPNGYEPWLVKAVEAYKPDGKFRVSITGRIYRGSVRPLVNGVDLAMRLEPKLQNLLEVVLLGHPDDPDIQRVPDRLRPYFHVRPFSNKVEAAKLQAESALLVCPVPFAGLLEGWIPYRLIEYFSRRRPILLLGKKGEAKEIVRRSGVGSVADPDDTEAIAESILAAFRRYERGEVQIDPATDVLQEWNVLNRVRQFAQLFDEISDF